MDANTTAIVEALGAGFDQLSYVIVVTWVGLSVVREVIAEMRERVAK